MVGFDFLRGLNVAVFYVSRGLNLCGGGGCCCVFMCMLGFVSAVFYAAGLYFLWG